MSRQREISAQRIVFGLSRVEDERSLADFLALVSNEKLAATLIPRMSQAEIEQVVDLFSRLMRSHLSGQEYHQLFLGEEPHSH